MKTIKFFLKRLNEDKFVYLKQIGIFLVLYLVLFYVFVFIVDYMQDILLNRVSYPTNLRDGFQFLKTITPYVLILMVIVNSNFKYKKIFGYIIFPVLTLIGLFFYANLVDNAFGKEVLIFKIIFIFLSAPLFLLNLAIFKMFLEIKKAQK